MTRISVPGYRALQTMITRATVIRNPGYRMLQTIMSRTMTRVIKAEPRDYQICDKNFAEELTKTLDNNFGRD